MADPFRCVECGSTNAAATWCPRCGASAFELARPVLTRQSRETPSGKLVSLQAMRQARARRAPANRPD